MPQKLYSNWTYEPEDSEESFELEITYTRSRYLPARIYGPPEDCYPAEGGEVEILDVTYRDQPFELPFEELEKIRIWLEENPRDEDEG